MLCYLLSLQKDLSYRVISVVKEQGTPPMCSDGYNGDGELWGADSHSLWVLFPGQEQIVQRISRKAYSVAPLEQIEGGGRVGRVVGYEKGGYYLEVWKRDARKRKYELEKEEILAESNPITHCSINKNVFYIVQKSNHGDYISVYRRIEGKLIFQYRFDAPINYSSIMKCFPHKTKPLIILQGMAASKVLVCEIKPNRLEPLVEMEGRDPVYIDNGNVIYLHSSKNQEGNSGTIGGDLEIKVEGSTAFIFYKLFSNPEMIDSTYLKKMIDDYILKQSQGVNVLYEVHSKLNLLLLCILTSEYDLFELTLKNFGYSPIYSEFRKRCIDSLDYAMENNMKQPMDIFIDYFLSLSTSSLYGTIPQKLISSGLLSTIPKWRSFALSNAFTPSLQAGCLSLSESLIQTDSPILTPSLVPLSTSLTPLSLSPLSAPLPSSLLLHPLADLFDTPYASILMRLFEEEKWFVVALESLWWVCAGAWSFGSAAGLGVQAIGSGGRAMNSALVFTLCIAVAAAVAAFVRAGRKYQGRKNWGAVKEEVTEVLLALAVGGVAGARAAGWWGWGGEEIEWPESFCVVGVNCGLVARIIVSLQVFDAFRIYVLQFIYCFSAFARFSLFLLITVCIFGLLNIHVLRGTRMPPAFPMDIDSIIIHLDHSLRVAIWNTDELTGLETIPEIIHYIVTILILGFFSYFFLVSSVVTSMFKLEDSQEFKLFEIKVRLLGDWVLLKTAFEPTSSDLSAGYIHLFSKSQPQH